MHPTLFNPAFSPPDDQAAAILDSLSDPDTTPRQVAALHNISLLTLSTFLARPDIQQGIATLESLAAARTRLTTADHLPAAARALRTIIDDFNNAPPPPVLPGEVSQGSASDGGGVSCSPPPVLPGEVAASSRPEGVSFESPATPEPRRPSPATAYRAASLLYRLARFQPSQPWVPRRSASGPLRLPSPSEPHGSHSPSHSPSDEREAQASDSSTPSARARTPTLSLHDILTQINHIAPDLLNPSPLDEPEARARPPALDIPEANDSLPPPAPHSEAATTPPPDEIDLYLASPDDSLLPAALDRATALIAAHHADPDSPPAAFDRVETFVAHLESTAAPTPGPAP